MGGQISVGGEIEVRKVGSDIRSSPPSLFGGGGTVYRVLPPRFSLRTPPLHI